MSDIINATPKGKAFTTLKIDDSTFQALFKGSESAENYRKRIHSFYS